MNKKLLITILSTVVAVALIATGLYLFAPFGKSDTVAPGVKDGDTKTSTEPAPDIKTPEEPTKTNPETELAEAQEMFPDVTGTDSHSKEDVQLSLRAAHMYVSATLADTNFTTGEFAKNENYDPEYFNNKYRPYFTAEGTAIIYGMMQVMLDDSYDENVKTQTFEKIRAMTGIETQYLDADYAPDDKCLKTGENCFKDPIQFGTIKWTETDNGTLVVTIPATSTPIFYRNGEKGYFERAHTFVLAMVDSDIENNAENGFASKAISEIDAGVEGTDWKPYTS